MNCFCRAKWRLWSGRDQMAGMKSMCLAIVWTEDHPSTMALGEYSLWRVEIDDNDRDRLELTMRVRVEKEKKKQESRDAWTRLISSGGELALDESGRNLGTECGKSPSGAWGPIRYVHNGECCPGNNRPASAKQLNNPQPALCLVDITSCSLLICAYINLRTMDRDPSCNWLSSASALVCSDYRIHGRASASLDR